MSWKRTCLLVALCIGAATWIFADSAAQLSDGEKTALDALNEARAKAGSPSLQAEWRLNRASRWQARHIADTNEIQHNRIRNTGLFGALENPEGRLTAALYLDRASESLVRSASAEPQTATMKLLHAPYHRVALLDPSATRVGMGLVLHSVQSVQFIYAGISLGGYVENPPQSIVVWPTDGASNVPAYFLPGTETPNPAPESKAVGYILTVQTGLGHTLTPTSFTLMNTSTREPVSGRVAFFGSDKDMQEQAVAFIPANPLAWDTEYKADFRGTQSSGRVEKSWSFHTARAPAIQLRVISVDGPQASLTIAMSSPDQPVHVCFRTSTGTKESVSWIDPERFRVSVSDCGANSCAVQISLSDLKNCASKKATIGALFGGEKPRTQPVLLGYS